MTIDTWRVYLDGDSYEDVTVSIQKSGNVYIALSPEMYGLIAVSKNLQKLQDLLVPQAIMDIYKATGKIVTLVQREKK